MRERNREINRRRRRAEKRRKLRGKLATSTTDAQKSEIEARIRKTYPKYRPIEA